MSGRLTSRVSKLEQSKGQGTYCLLFPSSWTQEKLDAVTARLKQTYADVLQLEMDDDDLVGYSGPGFEVTCTREEALEELD